MYVYNAYKLSLQIKILNRIQCTLGARVLDGPTIGQSDQPDSVSVSVYPSLKTIACLLMDAHELSHYLTCTCRRSPPLNHQQSL